MPKPWSFVLLLIIMMTNILPAASAPPLVVATRDGSALIDFALKRLEQTLRDRGHQLTRRPLDQTTTAHLVVVDSPQRAGEIELTDVYANDPGPDGFRLVRTSRQGRTTTIVAGGDERGAMYGVLDLDEQLRLKGSLDEVPQRTVRARFPFRAIKFNLPWMSYRKSEALQLHTETCRDLKFWEAFLDMMAQNRFNALTLWNLHPFTFMIRPRNFPEASPFSDAELAEWQQFWRTLLRMARERGIETYIINWNIFVSPEFARAHNIARYSEDWSYTGDGETSALVERYMKECVTQVIDEYEDLAGIGITLGERMGGMTAPQRRDWIERTVLAGMQAAKRKAKLIYRAPLSAGTGSGGSTSVSTEKLTRATLEKLDVPAPVWVEFKYNWSHAHSSPRLSIVHGGAITDTYWNPMPENYRIVWTMRNEDFFVLRWGEPSFIREFIANNGENWTGGCIIGSECYIPARDYMSLEGPHKTWQYAFERQWLFYALWGRLLYDPTTPDALFAAQLSQRHGVGLGANLLQAWSLASKSALRFASFYRGTWDATIYTEGFTGWKPNNEAAFVDINSFINREVLDARYLSIAGFVKAGGQVRPGKITPLELADQTERDCREAQRIIASIRARAKVSPTLDCEMTDIEAWSWYGRYFAGKLRGGVALAQFRATGDKTQQQTAIAALETAKEHWVQLVQAVTRYNKPEIPYVFDAHFSWSKHLPDVQQDIEIARSSRPEG